ncbi:hypothetical protein ASD00_36350 [Ensifer sp. Root31]|uniref:hypothetical protein n=1 Tax=Ensifer sp. Root31 TaxID=1736512 RepID=UPI00070F8E67|nr:hypothetical protein [Ensifer sp. Root31]KQU79327.1 hypothetical protein ASD00_36350 [Ensifer sp. Root31]
MRSVPWMTDDSVEFICNFSAGTKDRTLQLPRVLEFGCGSSTLFYAFKSSLLISFEHDVAWSKKVIGHLEIEGVNHAHVHLLPRPYSTKVAEIVGDFKFDLISIDGRDRLLCLQEALRLDLLAPNGIIVIDNTERITTEDKRYAPMVDELDNHGFRHTHFEQLGMDRSGWIAPHRWLTTVAWKAAGIQYTSKGLQV